MPQKNDIFEFDREKAIEVILYIAERIADPTYYSIGKLLYFADKTSLDEFGRFICGETYVAMEKGPVPSNIYDMMKEAVGTGSNGFIVEGNHNIKALRSADLDKLSDSDIQCLDKTIEVYGRIPNWDKRRIADDDAYYEAWNARGNKSSHPISIESIAREFEDSDDLIEYLHHRHDD